MHSMIPLSHRKTETRNVLCLYMKIWTKRKVHKQYTPIVNCNFRGKGWGKNCGPFWSCTFIWLLQQKDLVSKPQNNPRTMWPALQSWEQEPLTRGTHYNNPREPCPQHTERAGGRLGEASEGSNVCCEKVPPSMYKSWV